MKIRVDVSRKVATCVDRQQYVCGNTDYVLDVHFDEEWNAHSTKTARFEYDGHYQEVVFSGNECSIPMITDTKSYAIEVGFYAGNLSTTTAARIMAVKSILSGDPVHEVPEEDVYNQFVAEVEENANKAFVSAVNAENSALDAYRDAQAAEASAEQALAAVADAEQVKGEVEQLADSADQSKDAAAQSASSAEQSATEAHQSATNAQNALQEMESKLDDLPSKAQVNQIQSDVTILKEDSAALQTAVDGLETDITEVKSDIVEVAEDIQLVKDDYLALQSSKITKPADAPAIGKVLKVKSVNADGTFVCEWADGGASDAVTDVQVAGTSVVTDGVAGLPALNGNNVYGIPRIQTWSGLVADGNNLFIHQATGNSLKSRLHYYPISAYTLNEALVAGLTDSNHIVLTEEQQATARGVMGAESTWNVFGEIDVEEPVLSVSFENVGVYKRYRCIVYGNIGLDNKYPYVQIGDENGKNLYPFYIRAYNNADFAAIVQLEIKEDCIFSTYISSATGFNGSTGCYAKPYGVFDRTKIKRISFVGNGSSYATGTKFVLMVAP